MPNQRDPNKTQIKAWVDKQTKNKVKEILDKHGLNMTDEILKLFKTIIEKEYENERDNRINSSNK